MSFWKRLFQSTGVLSHQQRAAINEAAQKGDLEPLKTMIKQNPSLVLSKDENDLTLLHGAATLGLKDMADLLIAKGADVNAKTDPGAWTALHWAAGNGHVDVVKVLLAGKAKVNAKNSFGSTPLHRAVGANHKEVVKILLAAKADVNARDKSDGWTPLHHAVVNGRKDLAELLLANRADVNVEANDGWTPLRWAAEKENGHSDIAELLRHHGGTDTTPFAIHDAARDGDLARVSALLKENRNLVRKRTATGWTPLHWAAVKGSKPVVESLLASKAEVDARSNDGDTPLHIAALNGSKDVAELLLASGAKVNAKNNTGLTPLGNVFGTNEHIRELLRKHGGHE
jgi:ankyrin repeat protein